jgi:beta-glucosidase
VTPVAQLLVPVLAADTDGRFGAARAQADAALALGVGGFLLYGGDQDAVRVLAKDLQQRSRTPLLIGADLERGAGQQFGGATGLPPLAAVAWLDDPEALRRAARLTAREARTMGVNWNLSPVCDLDPTGSSPVLGTRVLGGDAAAVSRRAAAFIEACQAEGVLACAKHFPGLGRAEEDAHTHRPVVRADREALHAEDLAPFRAAFAANVASVMTAHVAYPALDPSGLPATLSREVITWLLRQQLRYDGLVVTDAMDMEGVLGAVTDDGEAAVRAVSAGCDVVLAPRDVGAAAAALGRALASGALDPARAQQSVRRRLKWAQWASPPNDWRRPSASDGVWGAQLADRVVHVLRGDPPPVGDALDVVVVDAAAPAPARAGAGRAGPREALFETLRTAGLDVRRVEALAPDARPTAVAYFAADAPGAGADGAERVRAVVRSAGELGRPVTVLHFAHPRTAPAVDGAAVVCAWSGDRAMQQAAARWLLARRAAPVAP